MYDKLSDGKHLFFEDRTNQKSMKGPKHYHNVFEIYFMDKGECHYFINDTIYHVTEGDLVLIPERTLHKTMYGESANARTLINCSRHFIPSAVADQLPSLLYLYRNESLVPTIRALLQQIRAEYTAPDSYSESVLTGHLHLLFYTLVRHRVRCSTPIAQNLYTGETIAYVKTHYTENVTLTDVAERIGVSPEHLSRVFKQETGFGFSEYLTMLRMQKAEAMLRGDASLRIADVAFACGFNDSNYFSTRFKQIYGFSPGQLRKK